MKRLYSIIFLFLLATSAMMAQTSGTCGDNLTWSLTASRNTLTISGSGTMYDYQEGKAPWYSQKGTITQVVIGESVTSIGTYAFAGLKNVEQFTLPDRMKEVKEGAFAGCAIYHLYIGSGMEYIHPYALEEVTRLDTVTWSTDMYRDGLKASQLPFNYVASKVKKFVVTDNVTVLPPYLCYNMTNLKTLVLSDDINEIGTQCFRYCKNLRSVTLPAYMDVVAKEVFEGCASLASIDLKNVTVIDSFAFSGCKALTSITLPAGLLRIRNGAFENCTSLRSITCLACPPPALHVNAFKGCAERLGSISVSLPAACENAYYRDPMWQMFFPKRIAPEKTLPGVFSVSPTKRVIFSQSNLQYNVPEAKWQFAEEQYETIGMANENISSTYGGRIDQFGWGTSGYRSKNPWMTSGTFGNGTQDITGTDYDWGIYNSIANGGDHAGEWYTLSSDEWDYLINQRPNAASLRSLATVMGVKGYILMPDGWVKPESYSFKPNATDVSANNYNDRFNTWKKMEAQGAVFFPAAGFRDGTEVDEVNEYGYYWTTTAHPEFTSWAGKVIFGQEKLVMEVGWASFRSFGYSVRLVRNAYPEGVETITDNRSQHTVTKFIKDGQLYIRLNGAVYDAKGTLIEKE